MCLRHGLLLGEHLLRRKDIRYSDFNMGSRLRTNADAMKERADWLSTTKERINKHTSPRLRRHCSRTLRILAVLRASLPRQDTVYPLPHKMQQHSDTERAYRQPHKAFHWHQPQTKRIQRHRHNAARRTGYREEVQRPGAAHCRRIGAIQHLLRDDGRLRRHPRPTLQLYAGHEFASSNEPRHN